jgi:hypothetical protein
MLPILSLDEDSLVRPHPNLGCISAPLVPELLYAIVIFEGGQCAFTGALFHVGGQGVFYNVRYFFSLQKWLSIRLFLAHDSSAFLFLFST